LHPIFARPTTTTTTLIRFDYQPDICKDYKDTGFCGFGDSCKFMHDRGNYKSGWQMEKEWDASQARRKQMIAMGVDPDEADNAGGEGGGSFAVSEVDALPFACHLCRGPFVDPVRTQCGHCFCQGCAVQRFQAGSANCSVCGKNTAGIFNACRKLNAHGAKRGGFAALFAQETALAEGTAVGSAASGSGVAGGADEWGEEQKDGGVKGVVTVKETPAASGAVGGAWAVVDDAEEEGVAALLEAEAAAKAAVDAAAAAAAQELADAAAAAEAAKAAEAAQQAEARAALAAAGLSVGWAQVSAHGQQYWHHAARNQTARSAPPYVLAAWRAATAGHGGGGGEVSGGSGEGGGRSAAGGSVPAASSAWVAQEDPATGRTYFFHPATRETSWEPR
jgi:hypothetical protein